MRIKKVYMWAIIIFSLLMFSTIGYMLILNISFLDALYMTVITISTVGYKEVVDLSDAGKIFSMIVILLSVGVIGYFLSEVFKFFSEGTINQNWRKRKMQKDIEKLTNHIIVCGSGETGIHVIKQLMIKDIDFVVIENSEDAIEALIDLGVKYIFDDATKEEALIEARVEQAKGLITCLAKDADNVFVVLTARELNKKLHIIARAHEDRSDVKLRRAGANQTVSPDEIGGKKMASLMINPQAQYFVDNIIYTKNLAIDMEEVSINEESELIGKKLSEAKISERAGLMVLALRKDEDNFIFNPRAKEVLNLGDKMLVVGSKEQIAILRDMAKEELF